MHEHLLLILHGTQAFMLESSGGQVRLLPGRTLAELLKPIWMIVLSLQLLVTCVVLFLGAFLAGLIPLSLRLTDSQLRLLTALGAGLLVSVALAVIIPEGFDAFADAQGDVGEHSLRAGLFCAPSLSIPAGSSHAGPP